MYTNTNEEVFILRTVTTQMDQYKTKRVKTSLIKFKNEQLIISVSNICEDIQSNGM